MQTKSTLILLGLVLLTGGYMLMFERSGDQSVAYRELNARAVRFAPESLSALRLKKGELEFECVRTDGKWMLSDPVIARVSVEKLDRLVTGLAALRRRDVVQVGGLSDAQKYGFDEPRARLEISDNQGSKVWLIGRDAPLGKLLYVMEEGGNEASVTDASILKLIPEKIEDIRDRTIFPSRMAVANRVDIRHKAGFLQLGADTSGRWKIQQPKVCLAENAEVSALLKAVLATRIERFVSDEVTDMAIYGLQDPQAQIMLASDEDTGAGLLIGNPVPDAPSLVYAKQTEEYAVFAVSTNALRLLQVDVDSLRERRLLPLSAARIEQVSIEKVGAAKLAMGVTEQGIWEVSEPHRWNIDPVKLALFFNIWQSAKIEQFIVLNLDESDPRGERVATVSFSGKAAEGPCVLTLYSPKKEGDFALCQREGEDVLFAFNPELLQMVDLSALDFKNRNILSLLPDQVGKITQVCGTNTVVLARNDVAEFVEPLSELWAVLANLSAVKFVAENPESLEEFGLDQPACRLTLALTDEGEIGKVLLLGAEYQGGRYAMLQGSDIVFIMGAEDADKLCGTLTDKGVETDNEKK
jgi:hypothetical protein